MKMLENKVALIVGVANSHSIATGCAQAFADAGAQIVLTYVNEKAKHYPHGKARIKAISKFYMQFFIRFFKSRHL